MIDGVRLNYSFTRRGHTQHAITIDNNILNITEVLFGSGSVLYGTDALGGSINFHTKDLKITSEQFKFQSGNIGGKIASPGIH
jgi:hemoglobin/transferrin/lactoferrin receptor protein